MVAVAVRLLFGHDAHRQGRQGRVFRGCDEQAAGIAIGDDTDLHGLLGAFEDPGAWGPVTAQTGCLSFASCSATAWSTLSVLAVTMTVDDGDPHSGVVASATSFAEAEAAATSVATLTTR